MTPKDALIEKMARAIAEASGMMPLDAYSVSYAIRKDYFVRIARAAYEAEHEETKG